MSVDIVSLYNWFLERPKWLQHATNIIIEKGKIDEDDWDTLLGICISEAENQTIVYRTITKEELGMEDQTIPLSLLSISDLKGINALYPRNPMIFGQNKLSIVYGRNGTGKSGYVRLLKHLTGVRNYNELLGDIYNDTPQPQSAKIVIKQRDIEQSYIWNGRPLPEVSGTEIYDTECGLIYVDKENEISYEPWLLRLFTKLTDACSVLNVKIQEKINFFVSVLPTIPSEYSVTSAGIWYSNLSSDTTAEDINTLAVWSKALEDKLGEIMRRLNEPDPLSKASTLERQKDNVSNLVNELNNLFNNLSDTNCTEHFLRKKDFISKRKTAEDHAQKVFSQAPLEGIGEESWRRLWEHARIYSEEIAYRKINFPNVNDGARCVLCQQELNDESKKRFISFEEFIKGELQKSVNEAEQKLMHSVRSFNDIPKPDYIVTKLEAGAITGKDIKDSVIVFSEHLENRRMYCLESENPDKIPELPSKDVIIKLEEIILDMQSQINNCKEDAKGDNRSELEKISKEFYTQKWITQQKDAIVNEVERCKRIDILEKAKNLTQTIALSRKKSTLTEELITGSYIHRFKDELKKLNASHLSVELVRTRAEVGHVYHRIRLKNSIRQHRTSDILSEGEFRIVSLAAFLADTERRESKRPFIFDDPISSLDQSYEISVAQRLVELSKTRQVIVFTHRLSLLALLDKYANKNDIEPVIISLSENTTGDITDLPVNLSRTDRATNRLLHDDLAKAKRSLSESNSDYEIKIKAICHDIRVLMEHIVEENLIYGVVKRYNPEIQTKNKIYFLAKITEDDCKFVDDMMTKYSFYEHSQSEETPIELPKLNEIETDLKTIISFLDSIKERQK